MQNLSLKLTPNSYHKPPEESLKTQSQELKISDTTKGQRDCTFPPSLENLVYFPYEFGQVFADRLMLETKSFRVINAAFRSPPETSSEIMHSGFFGTFQRQEVSIPLKKLQLVFEFSSTPHHIYSDSLGQYAISLILRESMEKTTAILAAKGWRGDRVTLYDVGRDEFIAWRSIWENEKEAKEFLRALLLSLEFRFRVKLLRESSQALMVLTGNQRILIDRTNNTVDMAILRPKT